jgi:uncharacterized protein DUF354
MESQLAGLEEMQDKLLKLEKQIERQLAGSSRGKIWVDLENSPHVPFFVPIIEELKSQGYSVVVTARDCFQVRELATFISSIGRSIHSCRASQGSKITRQRTLRGFDECLVFPSTF